MTVHRRAPFLMSGPRPSRYVCWAALVIAAACLSFLGCNTPRDEPVAASGVTVTDSAGRRIVRFSDLGALSLAERSATVRAEAGRQQGSELYQVSAARLLGDGRLAVGNSGTSEILYFDTAGGLERRVGGSGDGPGEYAAVTAFVDVTADTLMVYDVRLGRLTALDPRGGVARTMRLEPPSRAVDLLPLARDARGNVLAVHGEARIFAMSGVRQDTVPLMVIDSSTGVDTIALLPGKEWSFASIGQGAFRTEVGFGRSVEASGRDGQAVVGSTDRLALIVVSADGRPIRQIEATGPNRAVPDADVQRWRARQLENLTADTPPAVRTALETAPYNLTFPAFAGLLLDADGRLWVGGADNSDSPDRTWTVFAPDGVPSFRIGLPPSAKPLDASGDLVVALSKTDLDEEVLHWIEIGPAQ